MITNSHSDPGQTSLEEYIPLAKAAAELPCRRAGKKTSVACLYRWTGKGCRGIRLRYIQVGSTRCTTRRWLREFFDALTASRSGKTSPKSYRSIARRQRDFSAAEKELDKLGV